MSMAIPGKRLKSCYTRDPLIMVKGGAIICRMGTRIRRGEELAVTRTLARLGVPILRTLSGTALMEGGSFAWINERTAVIGCGIRVNREGAEQVGGVATGVGAPWYTSGTHIWKGTIAILKPKPAMSRIIARMRTERLSRPFVGDVGANFREHASCR